QRYAKAFPSLGVPAVNNPTFIQGVLLEPDGQHVRPFWNWALPDGQHAIITVRLNRDASLDQVRQVVAIVRGASSSGDLKELHDLRFVVSGSPALTLSVADAVFNALRLLVPLALVAVLIVGLLALGRSMLLTVLVAALGALWTAGIAGFLGIPVTPGTLVVLPVVLGLATDYFIQSVNRVMDTEGMLEERIALAARRVLPSTGLAAAATAAGMLDEEQGRREVALAGEMNLVVAGREAASPEAVTWLDKATRQAVSQSGGDLRPLESLPGFLAGFNKGTLPDTSLTKLILDRF